MNKKFWESKWLGILLVALLVIVFFGLGFNDGYIKGNQEKICPTITETVNVSRPFI